MPNPFTNNTLKNDYKDDFLDSAGYYRILFNSGRPLQARELTQLQTILQNQITKFAQNVFLDGAAVSPKGAGAGTDLRSYVIVDELLDDVEDYLGAVFTGSSTHSNKTTGLIFVCSHVEVASGDDLPVLYGRYISQASSGASSTDNVANTLSFLDEETLTSPGLVNLKVHKQGPGEPTSTGRGVIFTMGSVDFFTQGHFVIAPKQQRAISKHTPQANADVGFEIVQDVVTALDDEALYDNQGARPNLSSPGADRYRIRLLLTTRDEIADKLDFLEFAKVRESKIVQIKSGTDNFNQIEKRAATRHSESLGDFIVHKHNLEISEWDDSNGDSKRLRYFMPAPNDLGENPLAYFEGFRLEQELDQILYVEKPISTTTDSGMNTGVSFKNYLGVRNDSANSFLGNWTPSNINLLTKHYLYNSSDSVIGNARIKSVVNTGYLKDSDGSGVATARGLPRQRETNYRVHLMDIQMKDGYNFRAVSKIGEYGTLNSEVIRPLLEDQQNYIQGPEENTSLFEISSHRVKSVSDVNVTVQRYFTDATGAGTSIGITAAASEEFVDKGQWTIINITDNQEEYVPAANITGTGNVATVTGLTTGKTYVIYAYVEKGQKSGGLVADTKKYTEGWFKLRRYTDSVGDRFLVTGQADGTALSGLYDGVRLLEAYDSDSDGSVITNNIVFDGGQRDNYYGPIYLTPNRGVSNLVDSVLAKIGYFTWTRNDGYFSPNSYLLTDAASATTQYPEFDYGDIPTFLSKLDGEPYPLHQYFDFRSKMDPLASSISAADYNEMPRDGGSISHGTTFYNKRIDAINLTYDAVTFKPRINVVKGDESLSPGVRGAMDKNMRLFNVLLNGNTKSINDLMVSQNRYPRYTMRDVDRLRTRVGRLEETVALSFIEQEAQNLIEQNSNNTIRSKTGFFVDDFSYGLALASSEVGPNFIDDESWITQTLDTLKGEIQPKHTKFWNDFYWDSANAYNGSTLGGPRASIPQLNNVVRRGDMLMLDYVEVLDSALTQEVISWRTPYSYEERGYYNVNPFNVFAGEGNLKVTPSRDFWVDHYRLPDRSVTNETIYIKLNDLSAYVPRTWTSTFVSTRTTVRDLGGRRINEQGRVEREVERTTTTRRLTQRTTERVRTRVVSDQIETFEDDKIIDVSTVPFIRNRRVLGKAEGLRPDTRFWLYFDGIRMDQWVLSRTEGSYTTLLAQRAHQTQYPTSWTTIKRHPNSLGVSNENALFSDANGNLYFDLFIPNTATIPIPKSDVFPYEEELDTWVKKVKEGVALYGAGSPQVYDYAGWKFRIGTREIKLLDISSGINADALSRAKTKYAAAGRAITRRKDIISTRVVRSEDYIDTVSGILESETIDSQTTVVWQPYDPLAQTFSLVGSSMTDGAFVTKVDIFLRSAPPPGKPQIPIQLQIRDVVNGTPVNAPISEQHCVYRSAADVYAIVNNIPNVTDPDEGTLNDILSNPVTFEFPEPIYIRAGKEYAICLLSDCDDYQAFIATTYDLIIGRTDKRVSKQPATGSLFLSQNGSSWTPKQNQDLAFRIYTAKFKNSGNVNFYNQPNFRTHHNYATSMRVDSDDLNRFRVDHFYHNLLDGDKVLIEGLGAATNYNGVTGASIMDTANVVVDPDITGYYVAIDNGSTFDSGSTGKFGADSVTSLSACNIDRFNWNISDVNFTGTSIRYEASFVSGFSHGQVGLSTATQDTRFNIDDAASTGTNGNGRFTLTPFETIYFDNPRYLANSDQTVNPSQLNGQPSIVVTTSMQTSQVSNFGGPRAQTFKSSGYVSDVTPIIDIQGVGAMMMNYLIDNQADNGVATTIRNAPTDYVAETNPLSGTTPSKHITKPVVLPEAGNGLRIIIKMHVPPQADFDTYYRTTTGSDDDIYSRNWIQLSAENDPSKDLYVQGSGELSYSEYRYLVGGVDGDLPDFRQFQVKVVLRSRNSCQIPIIRDIKAIALI